MLRPAVRFLLLSITLTLSSFGYSYEVSLKQENGVLTVPARLNDIITLDFVVDSGAAEVQIPADVVMTLLRTKTITQADFLPGQVYRMADGSTVKGERFNLRSLKLGEIEISNVSASISSVDGMLLLGQSVLSRLSSWSIDNNRHVLLLGQTATSPQNMLPSKSPSVYAAAINALDLSEDNTLIGDWGNSIMAIAGHLKCANEELYLKGYKYAFFVTIPASRVRNQNQAWDITGDRALTVQGCWYPADENHGQAFLIRKSDDKVWEQSMNFQDGTWRKFQK